MIPTVQDSTFSLDKTAYFCDCGILNHLLTELWRTCGGLFSLRTEIKVCACLSPQLFVMFWC